MTDNNDKGMNLKMCKKIWDSKYADRNIPKSYIVYLF